MSRQTLDVAKVALPELRQGVVDLLKDYAVIPDGRVTPEDHREVVMSLGSIFHERLRRIEDALGVES